MARLQAGKRSFSDPRQPFAKRNFFGTKHQFAGTGMKKVTARFYALPSGRRPVREWLLAMSREDRHQIGIDIQKVEFGWPLGMPYCRALRDGLWEVRSDLPRGRIVRILFFILEGEMVLLHGFEKKTQKTPVQDIALALKRKRELESG